MNERISHIKSRIKKNSLLLQILPLAPENTGTCQDDKLFGWSVGGVVRHIFSVLLYDYAAIYFSNINVILPAPWGIKTVVSRFEKKL